MHLVLTYVSPFYKTFIHSIAGHRTIFLNFCMDLCIRNPEINDYLPSCHVIPSFFALATTFTNSANYTNFSLSKLSYFKSNISCSLLSYYARGHVAHCQSSTLVIVNVKYLSCMIDFSYFHVVM